MRPNVPRAKLHELIAALPPARAAALLGLMADDRATDIVHELDDAERARLIPLLAPEAPLRQNAGSGCRAVAAERRRWGHERSHH